MLTKNQSVSLEEIRVIMSNFSELDITNSGLLEQHDVDEWISRGSKTPAGLRLGRKCRKTSQLSSHLSAVAVLSSLINLYYIYIYLLFLLLLLLTVILYYHHY